VIGFRANLAASCKPQTLFATAYTDFDIAVGLLASDDGSVSGYAQVFGDSVADRIRLEGSTFAAAPITATRLPAPVSSCSRAAVSGDQG